MRQPPVEQSFSQARLRGFSARQGSPIHRPAVLFLTGFSGAGKSTLASALEVWLRTNGFLATVVDGDKLRTGLCRDLGFSPADRHENFRRATELALHLAELGAVVIVALIAPFRADREMAAKRAREKGLPFAEVFINASLAVCERRDPKHLYKRARAGEIQAFTGIDSPYETPLSPALELQTDALDVAACTNRLIDFTLDLVRPAAGAGGAPGALA